MRVTSVNALSGFRLELTFSDGVRGTVSVESRLFGPVFERLNDAGLFSQLRVGEFGAVCWPNGANLAPEGLYRLVESGVHAV